MRRLLIVLIALAILLAVATYASRESVAKSLVCEPSDAPSDAIVIDNLDLDYLLFEESEKLIRKGLSKRVVVGVQSNKDPSKPGRVQKGFVEVMAEVARIDKVEMVPFQEKEPITLNTARTVATYLKQQNIHSAILVAPGFRSYRSELAYRAAFEPEGIEVRCVPVFGTKTPENWTETWHGIQEVILQAIKLAYYRVAVL